MALRRPFSRLWSMGLERCLSTGGGSVDAAEVEKFVEVDWWNRRGDCGALHRLNPVRTRFLRDAAVARFGEGGARRPLENKTAVDVGCGGGIFSESLARLGAKVTGVDVLQRNIDVAKQHADHDPELKNRLRYRCASAEDMVQKGETFDIVVASEVIEHVNNPLEFLRTLSELMSDDGLLCLTTINRTLPSLIGAVWIAESVLRIVPQGTHDWSRFLTPKELTAAANRCGLKLDRMTGLRLKLLTGRWTASNDTSINYASTFIKHATSTKSKTH